MYVRLMPLLIIGALASAQEPAPQAVPRPAPLEQATPRDWVKPQPDRTLRLQFPRQAAPQSEGTPRPLPTPEFRLFPQPSPGQPRVQRFRGLPFVASLTSRAAPQRTEPSKVCSIPLLEMPGTRNYEGKIVTIEPMGASANMPTVPLPAPPCDRR
jgi:hypothetical protein